VHLLRFVTHLDVDDGDVEEAAAIVEATMASLVAWRGAEAAPAPRATGHGGRRAPRGEREAGCLNSICCLLM
jgi:hypothetical protein